MRRAHPYLAGAAALAVGLCPITLSAQIPEAMGGIWIDGTLSFSLENDEDGPEFRTGLDLGLSTANRTQQLRFSSDFGLTVPLDDTGAAEFDDPNYQLEYLRDTGRSRISASTSVEISDIDGTTLAFDPDADPVDFDELDLIDDDGTRQRREVLLGVEWGLEDPIGGTLFYEQAETTFDGTADTSLVDSRATSLSGTLRLDADQTLSFVLDASHRMTEEDANAANPETETEVVRTGVRTQWQMTPVLAMNGRLGWAEITETETIGPLTFVDEVHGTEITFGLALDRPNGSWALDYDRVLTSVGLQDTLSVTRALELQRGTFVTASLGVRHMPSGESYMIGSVDYERETRRGEINVSGSREVDVNNEDFEVLRDRFRASYGEDLPNGASWSVSGTLLHIDYTDPTEADLETGELSLNYTKPLTRDWTLSGGISLSETREDGLDPDRTTTVSLTLERPFMLRP